MCVISFSLTGVFAKTGRNSSPNSTLVRRTRLLYPDRPTFEPDQSKQRGFDFTFWYTLFLTSMAAYNDNPTTLGYLAIHLLGLSTGTLLLPPSPSVFRHQRDELLGSTSTSTPRPQSAHLSPDGRSRRGSIILSADRRENDKTAIELCSWAVVWWVLLGVERGFGLGGEVSRRLVSEPPISRVISHLVPLLGKSALCDLRRCIQHVVPSGIPHP